MAHKSPASLRLDRLLAQATGLSRAQAQAEIRTGMVQVAGRVITDPAQHVVADAPVELGGRVLERPRHRYFMLHKPAGVVCAASDRSHRTVMDLLPVANPAGLHVAGRLDIDATGLVLITDDGEWSHRLTSPRHKQPKTYRVELAEPLSAAARRQLEDGMQLHGESRACAPVVVEAVAGHILRLTLTEGKYHQVKRMLAAVGNHVTALHRERIGAIVLDSGLAPGESRSLMPAEISAGAGETLENQSV